eukprot:2945282-Rhodomonas_salina.1
MIKTETAMAQEEKGEKNRGEKQMRVTRDREGDCSEIAREIERGRESERERARREGASERGREGVCVCDR